MKTPLIIALLLAAAAVPTVAAAKPGDLYVNADGSCDKGDTKQGYWCVESRMARPATSRTASGKTGAAPKPQRIFPKPGVSLTEKPMP